MKRAIISIDWGPSIFWKCVCFSCLQSFGLQNYLRNHRILDPPTWDPSGHITTRIHSSFHSTYYSKHTSPTEWYNSLSKILLRCHLGEMKLCPPGGGCTLNRWSLYGDISATDRIHGSRSQGMESKVDSITMIPCDPLGGFVLPVSEVLGSTGLEILILIGWILLLGNTMEIPLNFKL